MLKLLFHISELIDEWNANKRSLFAFELQLAFVLSKEEYDFALPNNWRLVEDFRQVQRMATLISPTVARDVEILDLLI